MRKKLTHKQKEYARRRAEGESYSAAYIGAGYSDVGGKEVATSNAYNLEHMRGATSTEIVRRIKELQERAEQGATMNREARLAWLADMVMDTSVKDENRLRAADMINRMSGDYTDRQTVTYQGGLALTYEDRRRMLLDGLGADTGDTQDA